MHPDAIMFERIIISSCYGGPQSPLHQAQIWGEFGNVQPAKSLR